MKTQKQVLIQRFLNMRTRIHAFLWNLTGDYHVAEDVFQEASLVILERCGDFTEGTHFEAWVFEIARRKALEKRRQLKRPSALLSDGAIENLQKAYAGSGCDDRELQDRLAALRRCIQKLSDQDRALMESRYVDGIQPRRLGQQFGKSADAIRFQIRRLRNTLAKCVSLTLRGPEPTP